MDDQEPEFLSRAAAISLPISLVFLGGVILACLLPWHQVAGVASGDALVLCLLVLLTTAQLGWCLVEHTYLQLGAVLGSALGAFLFFVTLAELTSARTPAGVGLWLAWVSSLGIWIPLLILAILEPLHWPQAGQLHVSFWVRRHASLLTGQVLALVLGVLYWLMAVWV